MTARRLNVESEARIAQLRALMAADQLRPGQVVALMVGGAGFALLGAAICGAIVKAAGL